MTGDGDGEDTLRRLVDTAADLVDDLAGRSAAEAVAFEQGYRLGFRSGEQVGEGRTANAALLAERDVLADLIGTKPSAAYAELECLRWGGPRRDAGRPRPGDHPGGPVDFETGTPRGTT